MKRHLFAFFFVLFASLPMLFAVSDAVGHKQETISDYENDSIPADSAETPVLHMNNDGTEGNIRPETRIWPEAPRAWQFRQVTMPVPALVTGAATFDVPLYEIELDGFKLPLSLKYHSNGIRIDDDYQPIGFGWTLTPPLRVTRKIYGRPDGDFRNISDTAVVDNQFFNDYSNVFKCAVNKSNAPSGDNDRFDTEHDVFSVHLADKSFNMIFDKGKFVTVGMDEYKIETDPRISYIRITDAMGNRYVFGGLGSMIGDYQLEWLPTSITTQEGKKITFEWRHGVRGSEYRYDPPIIYNYQALGAPVPDYMMENTSGVPSLLSGVNNIYDMTKIDFSDGYVEMNYDNYVMMTSLVVRDKSGNKIRGAYLSHSADHKYLTDIKIDGTGCYSFDYIKCDNVYKSGQDWWGFPNGVTTNNDRLAPSVKMTSYKHASIFGADRRVDSLYTSHGMMRKAVYPTGATAEWEYEIHKFPKQVAALNGSDPIFEEIELSAGGGVRVKKLSVYNGTEDNAPIVRKYIYGTGGSGLANCVACPSISSFVSFNKRKDVWASQEQLLETTLYNTFEDRYLTIDRSSNHADYRTGETLIWYPEVKEIEGEGYTVYNFKMHCRDNVFYTHPIDHNPLYLYTIFSSGPLETSRKTYNSSGRLVQSVEKTYKLIELEKNWLNQSIGREYIQTADDYLSPDFDENRKIVFPYGTTGAPGQYGLLEIECPADNYKVIPYRIYACTEQLVSEKTVLNTLQGKIEKTTKTEYVDGTSLPLRVTVSSGSESFVRTYSYDCGQPTVAAKMKAANVVGYVTGMTEAYSGATSSYQYDMGCFGTSFRPVRIWKQRGSGPQWCEASYSWNNDGTLKSSTGSDGIQTTWTWDASGRYPLSKTTGGTLTSTAVWKNLVGVTSVTGPDGIRKEFEYDSEGRLSKVSENGDPMENYDYRISHDGNNYINVWKYTSKTSNILSAQHYDAMGRLWGTFTPLASGAVATIREYDSMGRPSRVWSPTPTTYQSSPEAVRNSAKQYYGNQEPYTEDYYEPSPRAFREGSAKAGSSRHGSGKGVRTVVYSNANFTSYNCKRYYVSDQGVAYARNWAPGLITVTVTTDEDGIITHTYTDLRGHTVCEKRNGKEAYYVYDDYGDLRYILPPGITGKTLSRSDSQMQDLAFWYDYDTRGQCILVKEPGRRVARKRYDPAGRLVAEQTSDHADGVWRVYAYDGCGRQVLAADCSMTESSAEAYASSVRKATFTIGGTHAGYNILPEISLTDPEVVWAKYYDNYDFVSNSEASSDLKFKYSLKPFESSLPLNPSPLSEREQARTEPYGSALGKLAGIYTGSGYEAYYYDKRGRELQRAATGFNIGRRTTYYTYDGKPSEQIYNYSLGISCIRDRVVEYEYDKTGRVVRTVTKNYIPQPLVKPSTGPGLNPTKPLPVSVGNTDSAIVVTRYDGAGRPAYITMGKAQKEQSYECNGWPTVSTVNYASRSLGERINYSESGRISSRSWNGHTYSYTYNDQGFLIAAGYSGESGSDYSTAYTYDDRGNILTLTRQGITDITSGGTCSYGLADGIDATYEGNRPVSLRIRSEAETFSRRTGFGADLDAALTYDSSGRLFSDESRGIVSIEYNNDGHPVRTEFSSGSVQTDEWDGLGNHLSTTYITDSKVVSRRWYTGDGHVVSSGTTDRLEMSRFDCGFFDNVGSVRFNLTNYRGDITAVIDKWGNILQTNDYYPYGEPWIEPSRSYSSFMFEGKERLRADGINEYDQGARRYAAAFPFFTTPDRKASSTPWLSPYSFCASNPINAVDPSGNRTFFISGMHYHDGGNPVYWGGLDKMVMKEVGDPKATYLDGSTGGVLGAYGVMGNFNVWARQIKGFALGVMMAPHLRKVLDKDEKIRFVSHSMGGAFTKGLIFGMSSVLGDKFTERVEFEIDLAPYQARNQKAVPNIQTYTIQHKDDQWAGTKEIEGATSVKSVTKDENGKAIVDHGVGGHGVASFILELQKFLQKRNNK